MRRLRGTVNRNMALLALSLPFIAALASLALNRLLATRIVAFGGAALMLVSVLLLFIEREARVAPRVLVDHIWLSWNDGGMRLVMTLDGLSWLLAVLVYGGGALLLAGSALALSPDLRGFGGLFAALLVGLGAAAAGTMVSAPLIMPVALAAIGLAWFAVLRSSGALPQSDAPLLISLGAIIAAMALLVAALAATTPAIGRLGPSLIVSCAVAAAFILFGLPPLHGSMLAISQAPGALAAFAPLGLPLLGAVALLRLLPEYLAIISDGARNALVAVGLLALFISAARSLWSRGLRQIVLAQFSAQLALVILCAGCGEPAFVAIAPGLILNATLSTLTLMLGVAALEYHSGSDELATMVIRPGGLAWVSGISVLIAAASAIGIPGAWGMWPKIWLFDALQATTPWVIAPLLAASGLQALALVAPLAGFWRASATTAPATPIGLRDGLLMAAAAPLLLLGAAPNTAWEWLLAPTTPVPPALPTLAGRVASAVAALLLIGLPALVQRSRLRRPPPVDERFDGVLTPESIGSALAAPAWLAAPTLAKAAHDWFDQAGVFIRRGLMILGRRYYLAAVVISLIVSILIFAAG